MKEGENKIQKNKKEELDLQMNFRKDKFEPKPFTEI